MPLNMEDLDFFKVLLEFKIHWQYACIFCNLSKYTERTNGAIILFRTKFNVLNQKNVHFTSKTEKGQSL